MKFKTIQPYARTDKDGKIVQPRTRYYCEGIRIPAGLFKLLVNHLTKTKVY